MRMMRRSQHGIARSESCKVLGFLCASPTTRREPGDARRLQLCSRRCLLRRYAMVLRPRTLADLARESRELIASLFNLIVIA